MDKNNIEALAAILDTAEKHGNAEVQIRLVFHEEEKPDITDLSDQLGQLKEKLETVKAHRDELDEEKECCDCDECDRFDYEEFSILDDKIDEVQSTVTDIHEAIKTMMEAIPNSFDKLTMDIMDNEGTAKIKKKGAAKIIAELDDIKGMIETGYGCILSRINNVENRMSDISETKDIALENQKRISNLINSLNAVIKADDGPSGDSKKVADMIKNVSDIKLVSEGNQHILGDLYRRLDKVERGIDKILDAIYQVSVNQHDGQAEIEKKLDEDNKNILNEVLTVKNHLIDIETGALYRQNKLETKLDAILKAINKPAKKSTTTKSTKSAK